jgi:molecular chaperone DnaK
MEDNQSTLSIEIYEGSPAGDIVGCIELTGIAPAPMYVPEIEVTFKFHENWELHVSAVDKTR